MPVIGFLHSQSPDSYTAVLAGFRQGLKEAGYVDGQNVAIEYRRANDQLDRLPALAADLVRRRAAVILAGGGPASTLAAKAATTTLPIVLVTGSDPVALGLVASLNRPGGNITGVTFLTSKLAGKRLDLLRELVPRATTVAYLSDPRLQNADESTNDVLAAAGVLGRQIIVVEARSADDFEAAFATLVQRKAGALLVGAEPLFTGNRAKLVALAARHKIPAIYQNRDCAVDGGLMSYGDSQADAFRLGAVYVGQILKGGPADLPVQQSIRFELVLNLKTAKGAWPRSAAQSAGSRRQGDRIKRAYTTAQPRRKPVDHRRR